LKGPRNAVIDRSQIARQARPIGDFIASKMREKLQIPPVPRVEPKGRPPFKPDKRRANATNREAPVLHDCLAYLRRQGIVAWRQNSGTAWIGGQPVAFGYPGAGDITGILPDGRRLEIECKSATGRQSEKQKRLSIGSK
jgi:hypothetical protein